MMVNILAFLRRLRSDEEGATAIEYGLLAALVGVTLITGASILGEAISDSFEDIAGCLENVDDCTE